MLQRARHLAHAQTRPQDVHGEPNLHSPAARERQGGRDGSSGQAPHPRQRLGHGSTGEPGDPVACQSNDESHDHRQRSPVGAESRSSSSPPQRAPGDEHGQLNRGRLQVTIDKEDRLRWCVAQRLKAGGRGRRLATVAWMSNHDRARALSDQRGVIGTAVIHHDDLS